MTTTRRPRTRTQSLTFSVDTTEARARLDALDEAGRGRLMEEVQRGLARSGQEAVGKVRAAVRRIPSWNLYGTGVRTTLAGNVESRSGTTATTAWVRIEVNPVGLPPGLAGAMDSTDRRVVPGHGRTWAFRHPVFGTGRWVNQATYPYFRRTLRGQKRTSDRILREVMNDYIKRL